MDAISCLAPPPALLPTNFADAAIARALHFSISDSADSSSSLSAPAPHHYLPDLPPACYAPLLTTTCGDSVLVADSPRRSPAAVGRRHQNQQLAPAGGRAGKRRSRASKRAPTTYISTDPANFRIMVQQITGVQAEPGEVDARMLQPATAVLLAAADTSAAGPYGNPMLLATGGGDDEASAALLRQQQPCFPTLDSWNVMYERSELL